MSGSTNALTTTPAWRNAAVTSATRAAWASTSTSALPMATTAPCRMRAVSRRPRSCATNPPATSAKIQGHVAELDF